MISDTIKKLFKMPEFIAGISILASLLVLTLITPILCKYSPHFLSDSLLAPPSPEHYFGTDSVGIDVFALVLHGARTSLKIGIIVALISSVIGVSLGAISGYFGGTTDKIISEILNIFMMVPSFFLIVLAISIYGSSIDNMILIMALTSWMGAARIMRGQALVLREAAYVKNAIILGQSHLKIIFSHIIPNSIPTIATNLTIMISAAILSEAGLSFLGLGDPNVISWGKIIASGRKYLPRCWWVCLFPGIAIIITSLSFYLIGDGINKSINVKSRDNRR